MQDARSYWKCKPPTGKIQTQTFDFSVISFLLAIGVFPQRPVYKASLAVEALLWSVVLANKNPGVSEFTAIITRLQGPHWQRHCSSSYSCTRTQYLTHKEHSIQICIILLYCVLVSFTQDSLSFKLKYIIDK